MSEMIERVARALAATRVYEGYDAETRARLIEGEMYRARRDVRLVLEAMREPTEAMIDAHETVQVRAARLEGFNAAEDVWCAMIDAALAEAPEEKP